LLKRAITYESFDGETVTEDFYFHISKADLTKLELSKFSDGGLEASLRKMMNARDGASIMEELDKIIMLSVGVKSEDGRRFVKTEAIREDFKSSPAYEVIFMELVTNAEKAAEFIAACIPGNIDVSELQEKSKNVFTEPEPEDVGDGRPQPEAKDPTALGQSDAASQRVLTRAEVQAMPQDELSHLLATGQAIIGQA
jgi:hypothetical protein